jgi:hypothetical protein
MTINVTLSPELLAKLRQRADAAQKDIEAYVQEIVEEKLSRPCDADTASILSPGEWSAQWHKWTSSHPHVDHFVDDSRESIYEGRGE